jgi:hypothetical protein
MAGKGDRPRPFSISQREYADRMEAIFGKKPPKERYVPPPIPEMNTEPKKTIDWGNDAETK